MAEVTERDWERARSLAPCTCPPLQVPPRADGRGPLPGGKHYDTCWSEIQDDIATALAQERAEAEAAERERCARLALQWSQEPGVPDWKMIEDARRDPADALIAHMKAWGRFIAECIQELPPAEASRIRAAVGEG